jgi:hypothetical protein
MASDAFFPFADGPAVAIEAGVRTIIQPGGSRRDPEVVEACNAAGVAMVFTSRRHFRHWRPLESRLWGWGGIGPAPISPWQLAQTSTHLAASCL